MNCSRCGTALPERAKFCLECGQAVATPAAPVEPRAERRQLTVMFCDLVGSTPLSQQVDPEELGVLIGAYQRAGAAVIESYEGYVAQYLGDGLLVYFGYPLAHEDDAQRAVRAGLGILDELAQLNARLESEGRPQLSARLGVHTGPVVVSEMGAGARREQLALGDTLNICARLQGIAAPGSLVISSATMRLVRGRFVVHDLGPQTLKGLNTPIVVYRVLRPADAQSPDALVAGSMTPLIGRERESAFLLDGWARARGGAGQTVLVSGEPGLGKSRLVQALRDSVAPEAHRWLTFRCSAFARNSAFFPVVEFLPQFFGFVPLDKPEARVRRIETGVAALGLDPALAVPPLAALLSLPAPQDHPPLALSAEALRRRTLQTLLDGIAAIVRREPAVLVVEDLHWIDPSSRELLDRLVERVRDLALLIVCTYRPEIEPPWSPSDNVAHLPLHRLTRGQIKAMIDWVAESRALPQEVVEQLVEKTDGVPLYVEEVTKMVLESELVEARGDRFELRAMLPPLAIPSTLQDSLMARLDRLAPAKEVAQLGATLGREFTYELLEAVAGKDETILRAALAQLVAAELLYQDGEPPAATYTFKHALVQDTAYQSLLKSRRQQVHQQVAHVIERRFRSMAETRPELLAHHYTAAGLAEPAVDRWLEAGRWAAQRSAYAEAINHLRNGLDVLRGMPETPERAQMELQLQVALGDAHIAIGGYGAPHVGEAYGRAREICQSLGALPQLGLVLGGVWVFYLIRADYRTARELAGQLMSLIPLLPIPSMEAGANSAMGATLFNLGELVAAREHLERTVAITEGDQLVLSTDMRVSSLCFLANVLTAMGYLDLAARRLDEAIQRARSLNRPFFLANALTQGAWVKQMHRAVDETRELAESAVALSREQGFPYWMTSCVMSRGWALVAGGEIEDGLAEMRNSLEIGDRSGSRRGLAMRLGIMAETQLTVGNLDAADRCLREARDHIDATSERFFEAEVLRVGGELAMRRGDQAAAARQLEQAVNVARAQAAKLWELRTARSLLKLHRGGPNEAWARDQLRELCEWFGGAGPGIDLDEAQRVLTEA